MHRVVFVSNRVATTAQTAQAGGLAVALGALQARRPSLWVGWSGEIRDASTEVTLETSQGSDVATLPLTKSEYRDYYLGYANSVIWPAFHNRVDLALFEAGYFDAYCTVNEKFARALASVLLPDDVVWVHDYHFLMLAEALRKFGVKNPIGLFLHIPFPATQAFMAIPEFAKLAHALGAFDLVGLQSRADVGRLIDTLEDAIQARLLPDGCVRLKDREVAIGSFPIGIDLDDVTEAAAASKPDHSPFLKLVGADRLDYTKGLPQKFRAFGRLLDKHAQYRGAVTLTQIAAPSRESVEAYSDIRGELETLCGAINGRFGELDWIPINYINRTMPRTQLLPIFRHARVGLVSPLADGMNLVAKEYIASQNSDDPGVLLLSRFAGAAEELPEALIINPFDVDGVADAMHEALQMPRDERIDRHGRLMQRLAGNTLELWVEGFLGALEASRQRFSRRALPADPAIDLTLQRMSGD